MLFLYMFIKISIKFKIYAKRNNISNKVIYYL